jgi:pimeloyl-ACP methyl ester carboxylesterase
VPFVNIQGYRIHYRERGQGRSVVLVHGLAGTSAFWEDTLQALQDGFRGIAPDLLGFGDSEKPRGRYDIVRHVEILVALIDRLSLDCVDLIGHSMGGTVALSYALRRPDNVRKMVLINTPVSGERALHGRGRLGATFPGLLAVKLGLELSPILWVFRRLSRYYYLLDPRFTGEARKSPLHALRGNATALKGTDLSSRLKEVKVPTLIMGTREDPIVRPSEFTRAAREIPGAAAVWIDRAGHCPTLERPEAAHWAIRDFLES